MSKILLTFIKIIIWMLEKGMARTKKKISCGLWAWNGKSSVIVWNVNVIFYFILVINQTQNVKEKGIGNIDDEKKKKKTNQ